MTYAISVPTPFTDISELAENFASRVDDERIMLPHSESIPEGEWVQFAVTLQDGSAALSGMGRCTGAYDNGEDRAAEHRFDIVMDNLQLEEMAQIYFERILQVRSAQMGEEPTTGQVEVPPDEPDEQAVAEEAAAFEESPEAVAPQVAEAFATDDEEFGGEATQAVAVDELDDAAQAALAGEEVAEAIPVESDAPAEEYAAAPPAEEVGEAYAEAAPAEAVAFAEDDTAGWDEAPVAQADEVSGMEMLDSVEEVVDEPAPAAEVRSIEPPTELRIPAETAIYELPPPSPPGQLPSPHQTNGHVLTRRMLHASWSPEPMPRPEPMPGTGLFQLAVGAPLPQPPQPPRPQIDPTLRVAPAPRPGDPHAAPAAMAAAPAASAAAYEEDAYAYDEGYEEAPPQETVEAQPFGADATMEGLGLPPEEGEYGDASEGADYAEIDAGDGDGVVVMDDETMDASMNEAYPPIAEEDDEAVYEPAPVEVGEETAVAVELPDDDEER